MTVTRCCLKCKASRSHLKLAHNNTKKTVLLLCLAHHGMIRWAWGKVFLYVCVVVVENRVIISSLSLHIQKKYCPLWFCVFWQHYSDEVCIAVGVMFTDRSRSVKFWIIALYISPGIPWHIVAHFKQEGQLTEFSKNTLSPVSLFFSLWQTPISLKFQTERQQICSLALKPPALGRWV